MANVVDLFGNKRVPTGFNPYAAGDKRYGAGRPMPNIGPVANTQGYSERDNRAEARKGAILRRMKGQSSGNPMNRAVMGYASGGVFS